MRNVRRVLSRLDWAARDVDRVRQQAKAVLEVDANRVLDFQQNPRGRLSVLAVIGPGEGLPGTWAEGTCMKEALLLEVGLFRTRPYRRTWKNQHQLSLEARRRVFSFLSPTQYQVVVAEALEYLQLYANFRVFAWETGPLFKMRKRWLPEGVNKWGDHRRGVRCTFAKAEERLVSDIKKMELTSREVRQSIRRIRSVVAERLEPHQQGFREFRKLKAADEIYRCFKHTSLSHAAKLEVVRGLSPKLKQQFGYYLLEFLKLDPSDRTLLEPHEARRPEYVNGVQLRIVREDKRYLVAEIFSDQSVPAH